VSKPLLIPMPGNEKLAASLTTAADAEIGRILVRRFPDDETYIRFETKIAGRTVTLLCTLAHPDDKFLPLLFAAATARELGAVRVGLVAPYLAYMRQDRRFKAGEAVTSNCFARILSDQFDWIVAVDPHLHRHASLGELFSVPTYVAHAASQISDWVRHEINAPLLIGPDSESEQWVAAVARGAGAPYVVLQKQRHSDREVQVTLPDLARSHTRSHRRHRLYRPNHDRDQLPVTADRHAAAYLHRRAWHLRRNGIRRLDRSRSSSARKHEYDSASDERDRYNRALGDGDQISASPARNQTAALTRQYPKMQNAPDRIMR